MHLLACATVFALAIAVVAEENSSTAAVEFYDPRQGGGSMLNRSGGPGFGEPLNVIISGLSSPAVFTPSGFLNYARAIGFSKECLGLHQGAPQPANLGDGHGWVNERQVLREHYHIPILGPCLESLVGGNHLRAYRQDGPTANSSALFLAVSQEKDVSDHHDIVPNGYNIGRPLPRSHRDRLVAAALGYRHFFGVTYRTTARNVTGLLSSGSEGINHGINIDGVVKLLTVTIV